MRVKEVADVGRREHIVARRPVLRHCQMGLTEPARGPVERPQYVIQPEEHRDLGQHRQTTKDRVEAVLALEFLHLQRHPLAILAVLLLQRLDLRLEFLHLAGRADLADEWLVQQRPQAEHQEHHRQCPGEEAARAEE